jgi:hypothetical protein
MFSVIFAQIPERGGWVDQTVEQGTISVDILSLNIVLAHEVLDTLWPIVAKIPSHLFKDFP